jgi:DNA-binding MarR family transcriptional regulator
MANHPTRRRGDQGDARQRAVSSLQREITSLVRRARARTADLHVELSLVEYSFLDYMSETGGCTASDLGRNFQLQRSTVSRQLAAMDSSGLVERRDNVEHRGSPLLLPSAQGRKALEVASRKRLEVLEERLEGWEVDDVATLAALLARYNAG